jgi:hypothetical protein
MTFIPLTPSVGKEKRILEGLTKSQSWPFRELVARLTLVAGLSPIGTRIMPKADNCVHHDSTTTDPALGDGIDR